MIMLSRVGDLLLLPWSLLSKLAMLLGSSVGRVGAMAFWLALFVGGALLANRLLRGRSRGGA